MNKVRKLNTKHLAEALFDFVVEPRSDFDVSDLRRLEPQLIARFPRMDERRRKTVTLHFGPDAPGQGIANESDLDGFVFHSSDAAVLAQFHANGFALNRLPPYTGFDELLPLALELWGRYCDIAKPVRLNRIALRYVNRFAVPDAEFRKWLNAPPPIPPDVAAKLVGFLTKSTIAFEDAILTHVVQRIEPGSLDMTLDIDAFENGDWPSTGPHVAARLAALRVRKNDVFFQYLTEPMLQVLA